VSAANRDIRVGVRFAHRQPTPLPRKRGKGLQTKPPPAFGGHPLFKGGLSFLRGFAASREKKQGAINRAPTL